MSALIVGGALLVAGAALLWVSWAGSQRRLARNRFVGIRVPPTTATDERWYAAHQAAAGAFGLGGAAAAACGLGVLFTGVDPVGVVVASLGLAALLTGTALATVAALRAVRDLPD